MVLFLCPTCPFHWAFAGDARDGEGQEAQTQEAQEDDLCKRIEGKVASTRPRDT